MIARWTELLLERAVEWNVPQGGTWKFLFNNNYHSHCSNMNLFWFHGQDEFPRVVTKIYREPRIVKREFENLVRIHAVVPSVVPRPLYFGFEGNFWTFWMDGVPGWRLPAADKHWPAVLGDVSETLLSVHVATRSHETAVGPDRHRSMVTAPLETLSRFGSSAAIREGCAAVAAASSIEWVNSLPIVPQHGDLFFGNLLSHRKRWYILDWESYGLIDLPLYDLLTLFLSLLLARGPVPERWPISLTRQIPALTESYSRAMDISVADTRLLFSLALANWFHLQWEDGRQQFATTMYNAVEQYFQHRDLWENIILPNVRK